MSDNTNNLSEFTKVTADLVATYDLSAADARSVMDIDYLCVYEYKYDGKTYKYRMRKRDNFDPIPEELELYFKNDPEKVFRKSTSTLTESESKKAFTTLLVVGIIFLAIFVMFIAMIIKEKFYGAIPVLIIVVAASIIKSRKDNPSAKPKKPAKRKKETKLDKLEEALLDGRFATAYLVKYRSVGWMYRREYRERHGRSPARYKAKYTYRYNGKDYRKTIYFDQDPPKSIRFFFGKNPRDVFFA